ncbi:MAG TPA: hypothetical protein PLV68_03920, partial [Ilumatobacteraceae bacterium]|nr:hypothetical protein [Ilumatobacteraceae bacterium]
MNTTDMPTLDTDVEVIELANLRHQQEQHLRFMARSRHIEKFETKPFPLDRGDAPTIERRLRGIAKALLADNSDAVKWIETGAANMTEKDIVEIITAAFDGVH